MWQVEAVNRSKNVVRIEGFYYSGILSQTYVPKQCGSGSNIDKMFLNVIPCSNSSFHRPISI